MKQEEMKKLIEELGYEEVLLFESTSYDNAFIGLTDDGRAAYDYYEMVQYLVDSDGMTEEEAEEFIQYNTINSYVKSGKLHPLVIYPNHYEYDRDEVYSLIRKSKQRVNLTYARVSLPKQKNDLKTQNERLYDFALRNGFAIKEQLQDVNSGLVRFGFDLFKEVFAKHGTTIIVMSESENKSYEQELTDDLISIIHYYSMKSYSNSRKLNEAEKALKNNTQNPETQGDN